MGIFGNLFGGNGSEEKEKSSKIPWIPLTDENQLEEIKSKSNSKAQFIFKHSTTCGISRMTLNMFTQNYALKEEEADFYFLDLHQNRNVSNLVSEIFQIRHESPQLLIIKEGQVIMHDSHGAIADITLEDYI
ncbi:bacillithiol system redox-active protein YtxJ [Cytophaga sp. FL35]|uniref:bacillithiol system redox-active protein YtxJ n=1 Tax=Cytophaga sp. FL35 TaxID=1904456 RepID=UPI0016538ACE|nr:bacillithiol system redox-active protein YtxJ [Cytophaga sp. FL35]MBC6998735.1 bacillithiol system redox-active protein YtxJ [Cytophaga sp. FL35]